MIILCVSLCVVCATVALVRSPNFSRTRELTLASVLVSLMILALDLLKFI